MRDTNFGIYLSLKGTRVELGITMHSSTSTMDLEPNGSNQPGKLGGIGLSGLISVLLITLRNMLPKIWSRISPSEFPGFELPEIPPMGPG